MTGCYTVRASRGAVAQLVARLVRIEKVRGSIPLSSTTVRDLRLVVTTVSLREPQEMIRASEGAPITGCPRGRSLRRLLATTWHAYERLGQRRASSSRINMSYPRLS